MDSATYNQQVESAAAQISSISIDKGIITGPVDQMTEMQKKLLYATIASKKIDGKTVVELAKSEDATEKAKAIRGVKQIVKSILESEILSIDDNENIKGIVH
ncbi:MAG: hypothetical protein WCP92_10090 [bacterium]